ncbi:MAG: Bpu10I family restriction endonuclease [Treponema sp.]|nr:Bpu10I family restriction endonuclease [Treponema sp.]
MSVYVHGDNIEQKENHQTKYLDKESKRFLTEIREKYEIWKSKNESLKGPLKLKNSTDYEIVKKRVVFFNEYKDFLDQQKYAEKFDSRSNLHSSALEEFIFYLFKDLVRDFSEHALIGKSHSFKDMFFRSGNFQDMITNPNVMIEKKDHDFVIGATINADFNCTGMNTHATESFDIPAVAIECKTYLDKTMLEGSSTAGEQLKSKNPNALYIVVAERLKLTEAVNLKKYKVDQIYVLRKQKNTDREFRYVPDYVSNPIYEDVVWHLYETVRNYLSTDWHGMIADGIERGYLI